MKTGKYDHQKIEKKWQKEWAKTKRYKTTEKKGKKKCYVLDMFPYPSGEGLHVGHPRGYIGTDIYSRFKKMQGYNVLHPMGWDAFGLPAEQYAIKHKVHPEIAVKKNVKRYKEQLSIIGFNYDWERELSTTDPAFYKWTQWTFLKMLEKGLAYQSYEPINWCPSCQTGLANEDLEGGKCERCGSDVEQKPMRQWVLKITNYADRMLADLDGLDWPHSVKESQKNWIGRSEGAEFEFKLVAHSKELEQALTVFTTRADTLFGVTYVVLAPEHELIVQLQSSIQNWTDVQNYITEVKNKTEIERTDATKEKTGVELKGITAVNPANGEAVPVWIADYVLHHYGTGAVMAVPAHDERDFAFAKKFGLVIKKVVARETGIKKENEEFRNGGAAVVFDPISQKYAVALHTDGKPLLFAGGVDAGEHVHDGIVREVKEESGLYDFKHVEWIETSHAHYFNTAKKVNRVARAECLLIILNSTKTKSINLEEHEKFTLGWMSADEIKSWWLSHNEEDGFLHYIRFLDESVARAIELEYDKTSDARKFISTAFTDHGILENSGEFTGSTSTEAREKITKAFGKKKVTYKLKDWVFSRQRYWGEPIPVIHCLACGVVPVPEKELPVLLPKVKSYEPSGTGESPLATIDKWVNVKCPKCKSPAKRETNTMPQWAGSSWYYLRYIDPKNKKALVDKKKEKYWSPVDMYVGGTEHATRHLIYARFWHKFLYDIKVVHRLEPFMRLQNQGMILASDGRKMSKRWGNVINPDDIVKNYGADTLRVYEMFMGPFDQSIAWNTDSIMGARRFIEKVWRLQYNVSKNKKQKTKNTELEKLLHKTIKKVTEDIETMQFNTAISSMMIVVNEMEKADEVTVSDFKLCIQLLAPFAPHVTEAIWSNLGNKKSIHISEWPTFDKKKIVDTVFTLVVQINGKVRAEMTVSIDATEEEVKQLVFADPRIEQWTKGKEVQKTFYVKGKLLSIVL
ncbi:MAG: class I tRNA ligase family protein [Candidatus Pacebacteria bacterium]|jgi:leucyl-tRNA synthetase|nr:class I tRNA ligase family protein [Candidatus Paceibacterota bacterium]